ncbi:transglycosylase SLT domain-containing protein [Pseudonocardia sp. C8]|uniref:transglycosylase SLT domain-containing protein n=1 Tax=Pseudonocardia sp. C8 TaxID=2762759 RepID=UPI001C92E13C
MATAPAALTAAPTAGSRGARATALPPPVSAARRAGTRTAATGAAFGVIASGAFAAVVPTSQDGESRADAEETTAATTRAAFTAPIPSSAPAADGSPSGYFSPVSFAQHTGAAAGALQAASPARDADLASLGKAQEIAAKIAAEHRKAAEAAQKRQAERARLDALVAKGGVDAWIAEALDHMGLSQSYAPGVKKIIMKESNGDPDAINNWDTNALSGNPSEGLMQVIPSTFEAYVHPDFADRDITDPVANITAGVRYMIDRYGVETLEAGGRSSASGGYLGY